MRKIVSLVGNIGSITIDRKCIYSLFMEPGCNAGDYFVYLRIFDYEARVVWLGEGNKEDMLVLYDKLSSQLTSKSIKQYLLGK